MLALAALVVGALPASGITFGQLDGNLHPNTGALVADYDPTSPGPDLLCSGTLISSTVFLTAGHCTDFLESEGITQAWVSFAPVVDDDAASPGGLLSGTWTTDPDYGYSGQGGNSDPHDLAVFVLDSPVGIAPAQLPTANLLGNMKKQLSQQTFTAVGYGIARDTKKTGPHAFTFDGARRYAFQTFSIAPGRVDHVLHEPVHGGRGRLLRRLGRPALPGRGAEQPDRLDHRHGRQRLPRDRQDVPARHAVGARLPGRLRHAALAAADANREERRRHQHAQPRLPPERARRHVERRRDAARGDEAELARGGGVAAARDEDGPEPLQRGPTGVPVGERERGMAGAARRGSAPSARSSASASRSAASEHLGLAGEPVAAKNARYGVCVGCANARWKRWSEDHRPALGDGNESRHSRSAWPSAMFAASSGFGRSRGRYGVVRGTATTIVSTGASSEAERRSIERRSASTWATDGGPA